MLPFLAHPPTLCMQPVTPPLQSPAPLTPLLSRELPWLLPWAGFLVGHCMAIWCGHSTNHAHRSQSRSKAGFFGLQLFGCTEETGGSAWNLANPDPHLGFGLLRPEETMVL